jgi:hypothetical protein
MTITELKETLELAEKHIGGDKKVFIKNIELVKESVNSYFAETIIKNTPEKDRKELNLDMNDIVLTLG